ncbi:MAG: sodium-dependent transporter, partial [Lachnospiraceae bacterium]|nr:sodium-dependent transporter [Lachnospiraceae bacterium]
STFEDELHWSRRKGTALKAVIMIALGSLSALGYGILSHVKIIGMQFLDFFDFLTNSVMMPLAAVSTCILINRVIGLDKIEEEITRDGHKFRRRPIFRFMMRYLCPLFCLIILVSSVLDAF